MTFKNESGARWILLALSLLYSGVASAEVMDKEFSLSTVLACGVAGAIALFAASRWLPWALAAVLPVTVGFFYLQISELIDPAVAPVIRDEAGLVYVAASWSLLFVCASALALGLYLRKLTANSA